MLTVTTKQLETTLRRIDRAHIVGLVARTTPEMRKTGNPLAGQVRKLSHLNGIIGFRYRSSVDRQRQREGRPTDADQLLLDFEPAPRQWGKPIKGTPLIEHRGRLYLEIQVLRTVRTEYRHAETGDPVDFAEIEPFLRKRGSEGARQQVRRPVILRDYRLESIQQLRMAGQVYTLRQPKQKAA